MLTRLLLTAGLAALPILVQAQATEFPPEVLGSYSTDKQCQSGFMMTVDPGTVVFDVAGGLLVVDDWDICLSCAGGAASQSADVMAFPKMDAQAPVFTFSPDPKGQVTIEYYGDAALAPELAAFADAGTLQRCE